MSDDYQNPVVDQITLIQAHWLSLMVCELFIIKSKLVSVCILYELSNMICVSFTQVSVIACT